MSWSMVRSSGRGARSWPSSSRKRGTPGSREGPGLSPRDIDQFAVPGLVGPQLVFVNGRYAPWLSSPGSLSDGATVSSLAQAFNDSRTVLEPHLARYADYARDGFTALNTAFMEDGGFVYVPRGRVIEAPIRLLYVSTETADPIVTHPRNVIVLEEDSQG